MTTWLTRYVDSSNLLDKAQKLFERDPLVGMLSIVVAGNALPGARDTSIVEGIDFKTARYPNAEKTKTHLVKLPDWDAAEWGWWLKLCVDISRAMEDERPEGAKPDPELDKVRELATGMLTSEGMLRPEVAQADRVSGDDEIGWLAWAVRILMVGGTLVKKQTVRAAKWAAPIAVTALKKVWAPVRTAFTKAPIKTSAGIALLAAPDVATKVVKSATTMAAGLFGAAAGGIIAGLGPLGIVLIAAGLWYAFGRGKKTED